MTLKIERISGKRRTRIRLSGELRAEHLDQLKAEIERAGPRASLDLEEVGLVDIEGVRFLIAQRRGGASQCCTVRLISGSGCSGNEVAQKASAHKRKKGQPDLEDEDGKNV
jgi:ABC-type transporter Mla MlaB component